METQIGTPEQAVDWLRRGEPVALPTETVYGLAADALRPEAVARIFEAKERPFFDPLIVHVPDTSAAENLAILPTSGVARRLMETFWPGPLTLIFPRREIVPDLVTAGHETVAIRMPAHPIFRAVLHAFGGPLAAPSANRFGRISPTSAADVLSELRGRIPLIVDGGPAQHGLESTIVEVHGETIRILRNGPITPEALAAFGSVQQVRATEHPIAPGQLKSHYAPRTPLELVNDAREWKGAPGIKAGLLAWAVEEDLERFAVREQLSERRDLREAAARIFAALRRLDEAGLDVIVAERVPAAGLGHAILDRLSKAAARD